MKKSTLNPNAKEFNPIKNPVPVVSKFFHSTNHLLETKLVAVVGILFALSKEQQRDFFSTNKSERSCLVQVCFGQLVK